MSNGTLHNGRTVAEVLNEFKGELKDFVATRGQMLRAEMQEKVGAWKQAVPAIAIGAVLLLFALLVFTAGLVEVIALAFTGQVWAMAAACFIVFALYALAGAFLALYGIRKAKEPGLAPERTLNVLKQDQIWLQHEARTEL